MKKELEIDEYVTGFNTSYRWADYKGNKGGFCMSRGKIKMTVTWKFTLETYLYFFRPSNESFLMYIF